MGNSCERQPLIVLAKLCEDGEPLLENQQEWPGELYYMCTRGSRFDVTFSSTFITGFMPTPCQFNNTAYTLI